MKHKAMTAKERAKFATAVRSIEIAIDILFDIEIESIGSTTRLKAREIRKELQRQKAAASILRNQMEYGIPPAIRDRGQEYLPDHFTVQNHDAEKRKLLRGTRGKNG